MKNITQHHLLSKFLFSTAALLLISLSYSHAQLTAWKFRDIVMIQEKSGSAKTNYQVLFSLNTQKLIADGKLKSNGDDIRFAKDCAGNNVYSHWIESGINTANTLIWILLDNLPANESTSAYLFYGNSAASGTSNFDNVFPSAKRRMISSAEVISETELNYDWIEIQSGGTITLAPNHTGKLTINARKLKVDGTIDFNGAGYKGGVGTTNGGGPGGGQTATNIFDGGGGGGYGGNGGNGSGVGTFGGSLYGTSSAATDIEQGSGGGAPGSNSPGIMGGNGGGAVILNATSVDITGAIKLQGLIGGAGSYSAAGGGSGGGVSVKADKVNISGSILANGAKGGTPTVTSLNYYGGGGGAGGRIKVFYSSQYKNTGTIQITGGALGGTSSSVSGVKGTAGDQGTFHREQLNTGFPAVSLVNFKSSNIKNGVCKGEPLKFSAVSGFSNYKFIRNDAVVQDGPENVYIAGDLLKDEKMVLIVTDNKGCTDTSQVITISAVFDPEQATIIPSDTVSLCQNDSLLLTASKGIAYLWSTGDTTQSVRVRGVGDYTVWVTDTNGCSTNSLPTTVIQAPVPVANFGYTPVGGFSVAFSDSSLHADEWLWDFGDGNTSTLRNPVHAYQDEGDYLVCLIVFNDSCGADTLCQSIYVEDTGVDNYVGYYIKVYPNPASDAVYLETAQGIRVNRLRISSVEGRELLRFSLSGQMQFNISALPLGIYFIELDTSEGQLIYKLHVVR